MDKRRIYTIGLTVMLLGVVATTYGVWLQGSFSHGEPGFDSGCYCHNNGIAIYVNGTGDGNGGIPLGQLAAGSSFHLLISTNNVAATGVVPGVQQWQSNQTDNAKFTFSPTQVTDGSAQDRSPTAGNITALYKVTAPTTAGFYTLTLYAQGTLMQPIYIQVNGGSTSTSSTTTSSTTTSSTTTSSQTTSSTSTTSSISTTSTASTTSTHTTSTSTTSSTTSATSSTSTTSSTTTSTMGSITFTSPSSGKSFTGPQSYTISGTISPTPSLPDNVVIEVQLQGSSTSLDFSIAAVSASGTFSYTTNVGGSSAWLTGTYVITAVDSNSARGTMTFQYTAAASTSTTTSSTTSSTTSISSSTTSTGSSTTTSFTSPTTSSTTSSILQSTTTSSRAPTTSSTTSTTSSTTTQSSSSFPTWAYVVIGAVLIAVVGAVYMVRRMSAQKAEGVGHSEQG